MKYDPVKVEKLASEAWNALSSLHDLASMQEDEFTGNRHLVGSAKYSLIVAAEACLDIANHIIAMNRYRTPKDSADTFKVLQEHDLLPQELSKRLQDMTRFRNRVVHVYWDVDDLVVYGYLQEDVNDIARFLDQIGSSLKQDD